MEMIKNFFRKKPNNKKITLGICAMDKKAQSKPMKEILKRLPPDLFEVIIFGDDCILNTAVESWPIVEALVAFYSTRFPTAKALEYVKLRKPYMINDLEMEQTLKDRRLVYNTLQSQGIDVPTHVFLERDKPDVVNVVEEFDEYIVVNGTQINKPLVEKPVDAEDHNIYIYYPMSTGGGSKRLFRKVDDRSSEFYPTVNELRTAGSYIYEEFVVTQGTDVKVYTVGPDYGHAEARKSPVVDGRVNRDSAGLEVRYPVILTLTEKEIARKVVMAFKQTVCGFDILRVHGRSYCCDVNGFSFVKNSRKYYDDASQVLIEIMLTALRPEYHAQLSTRAPLIRQVSNPNSNGNSRKRQPSNPDLCAVAAAALSLGLPQSVEGQGPGDRRSPSPGTVDCTPVTDRPKTNQREEELRCVIAVIRHGDRTPKQKMKIKVCEAKYLDYFHFYSKSATKDLKVKSKSALVKFLDITREIIVASEESSQCGLDVELYRKLRQIRDVLERWEISGINRKLQMKPLSWSREGDSSLATEVLLILKWGGDLTPLGREQAELLGAKFRHEMYPDHEGGGFLRLHATYRHDLKIKASDEGRVMKTAAAFAKGLLELEGNLTPILASLVTVEEKNRLLLDKGGNYEIMGDLHRCKEHLNLLQTDEVITEELVQKLAPDCPLAVRNAMLSLHNPLQTLRQMHQLMGDLCQELNIFALTAQAAESSKMSNLSLATIPSAESLTACSTVASSPVVDNALNKHMSDCGLALGLEDSNSQLNLSGLSPSGTSCEGIAMSQPQSSVGSASPARDSGESTAGEAALDSSAVSTEFGNDSSRQFAKPVELYLNETFGLMVDRWEKLYKDFFSAKSNLFDLTKVPDVYDMIRYDCLHNQHLNLACMTELFTLATRFENSVVPQEYGTDKTDKRVIGSKMCGALLEKIKLDLTVSQSNAFMDMGYLLDQSHAEDLAINSLGRCVRTRLYFTSESHIHTLLNVLRFPAEGHQCALSQQGLDRLNAIPELSYLTQVVIRLFEAHDGDSPYKYRCELSLSPGATNCPLTDNSTTVAPYIQLNKSISCENLLTCLDDAIAASKRDSESPLSDESTKTQDDLVSGSDHIHVGIKADLPRTPSCNGAQDVIVVASSSLETSDNWEVQTVPNTSTSASSKAKKTKKSPKPVKPPTVPMEIPVKSLQAQFDGAK